MDWNLDSYFPAFDGPEYQGFKRLLDDALAALKERVEALDAVEPASFAAWQAVVEGVEDLSRRLSHLSSYLGCLSACDAANEDYRREEAALALLEAEMKKLEVALVAAFGAARHDHFEAFLKRDVLAGAEFSLWRWRERSRWVMSLEEEELAAELEVDGLKAWSRLYDTIAGNLEFTLVRPDGKTEVVPMSRRNALLGDANRALRAAVFKAANEAWSAVAPVCAAALNAISGSRLTLVSKRNHSHFLEPALVEHRIGVNAVEALREALLARAAVPRGLLRRKAARMGGKAVAWYDLPAPTPGVGGDGGRLTWDEGRERVGRAFSRAYPRLGDFFERMVARNWFDHSPRRGKRPGGFCTTSLLHGESRVFMTFDGTMNDVVTLAHEVGHAWHGHLLRETRPLARQYPMTLAESASTFAEMLLVEGLLGDSSVSEAVRGQLFDAEARHATSFLLDVPMRFEFERRLYEERAKGEVTVTRLKELMADAQRTFFGDALAEGGEDPFFWASKLHFYIADVPFYNFPYTVGFLLSRTLFARFKKEGAAFLPAYEAFLARSGSASCEDLARDVLGADLASPAFWSEAIDSVADLGDRLDALLQA